MFSDRGFQRCATGVASAFPRKGGRVARPSREIFLVFVQLALFVTAPWITNAQVTAVNAGNRDGEAVAAGQYKDYIFVVPGSNNVESLVTIRISPTRGDPDIFVNRYASYPATSSKHEFKSTGSGTLEREAVAFVISRGARIFISVYGKEYSEFNLQITAEDFAPETLTSGQGGSYNVAFGSRKYFRINVPAVLSELAFSFTSDSRVNMNTRSTSNIVFEIPESSVQVSPIYYDENFAVHNGSAYSKREVIYANTRGLSTASKIYLVGPRTVYLYVSGGLKPWKADEDTTLPFTLRVDVKAAKVLCVNGTHPLDSAAQSIGFGEMHFYSIYVPKSWPYLHLELLSLADKVDMLLGYSVDFPLSDNEALHVSKKCSNCVQNHARRKLASRPEKWPETAAWNGAPKGACGQLSTTSDLHAFMHVVARSASTAGRTAQYRMLAWGLDNDCGWRPSCQACSRAGSICSWCNTGASNGFCGAKNVADVSGFPGSTCRNSYCPVPDTCTAHSSCGECTQASGCGWCANAEHGGVCMSNAGATLLGPPSGTCDAWLTGPKSNCAAACAVHDAAIKPCAACALDAGCGYCQSSLAGGTCTSGTAAGAATGQCPRAGAKWAFGSVSACTAAGADLDSQNTTSAVPIFVGAAASVGTLDRGNEACALGACRSVVFVMDVAEDGPHDLLATLEITGVDNVTNSKIIGGGVRLLARYNKVPLAAEGEHDVRGIGMSSSNDTSVLVAPLGLCDSKGKRVYFSVQLVHPPPVNVGSISNLNFKLKVERRSSTLDIAPLEGIQILRPDWTCCGQERHVSLKLPPGTEYSLPVKVKTIGTEGLRILTRKGACPTSALADRDSGATGSVVMTVDPPPATASIAAAAAVRWYVAIVGDTGTGTGKTSFAISAVQEASVKAIGPVSNSNGKDDESWIWRYRWYFFGLACAMMITFIGVTAVMIYRRSRRITSPSNALALTSDSLAYDLEMAGTLHASAENPLSLQSPLKQNLNGNPLAMMATSEQTSEAEEQLVTLIMDLQSKIEKLETENKALRGEDKFKKVATGAVKARRVAKVVAELVGSNECNTNQNPQSANRIESKDIEFVGAMEAQEVVNEPDSLPLDVMAVTSKLADDSGRQGMLRQKATAQQGRSQEKLISKKTSAKTSSGEISPSTAQPSAGMESGIPVTSMLRQEAAGAIPAEAKTAELKPQVSDLGLKDKFDAEPDVTPTAPVNADADVSVSDLPSDTLKLNVSKESFLPTLASEAERGEEKSSPSHGVHTFSVVCPDGTTLNLETDRQVLGRGIGGIRSKKVSREQAQIVVNFESGTAELEMLGKNPGATRSKSANADWLPLHKGVRRMLFMGDEFLLLAGDANTSEGDKDDARTQVFSLVHVPPDGA